MALLNTGHTGVKYNRYHHLIKARGVKPIYIIHDVIPIKYPQYCGSNSQKQYNAGIKRILETAHGIITVSEMTKTEVVAHALAVGKTLPLLLSAPLAPAIKRPLFAPVRQLSTPYFVILGAIEPRKNHLLLLRVWLQLAKQANSIMPILLIIGHRGPQSKDVVDLLQQSELLNSIVIERSRCSDEELVDYLYHAQALLFPTFAEGYGMPLVEALSLGTPVIASDLPVFREFAQDIPDYLDPFDEEKWLETIKAYTDSNHILRINQLKRLTRFSTPSWETHFAKVDAFLEELK